MLNKLLKSLNPLKMIKTRKMRNLCDYACLALLLLACYYVIKMVNNYLNREGYDNLKNTLGSKRFCLIHMDGCGHCERLMPDWLKLEKENNANNTGIVMQAINMKTSEGKKLVDENNISGFPTMLLLDSNGKKIKAYEGDRTIEGLKSFIENNK